MRERIRVTHPEGGESKVKQSLTEGTDINKILARWTRDGAGTAHVNRQAPRYGDFSSGVDYQEAANAIRAAERDFAELPSAVRAHVKNDPGEFLDMIFDPERRSELVELGLVPDAVPEEIAPKMQDLEDLRQAVKAAEAKLVSMSAAEEAAKRVAEVPEGK